MDYITSKVFVIALGIFVTLTIVTGVILVFTQLGDIYSAVENTDTSIISQFDNMYSMYSGAELNTVGLLNTLRKYEEDENVRIQVSFTEGEELSEWSGKTNLINLLNDKVVGEDTLVDLDSYNIVADTKFSVLVKEENLQIYIIFQRI